MEFKLKPLSEQSIKRHIKGCEGKHIQQVVYSSYHNALTQICFGCRKVRNKLVLFIIANN